MKHIAFRKIIGDENSESSLPMATAQPAQSYENPLLRRLAGVVASRSQKDRVRIEPPSAIALPDFR